MRKIPNIKNAVVQTRAVATWRSGERHAPSVGELPQYLAINAALFERLVGGEAAVRLDQAQLKSMAKATALFEGAILGVFQSEAFSDLAGGWTEFFTAELPVNQRERVRHALRDCNTVLGSQCLLIGLGRALHRLAVARKNGSARGKRARSANNAEFPVETLPAFIRKLIKEEQKSSRPNEFEGTIRRLLEPRTAPSTREQGRGGKPVDVGYDIRRATPPWSNPRMEALWLTKAIHEMDWPLPKFVTQDLPRRGPGSTPTIDQVRWLFRRSHESVLTVAREGVDVEGLPQARADNIVLTAFENNWDDKKLAAFGYWPFSAGDAAELATIAVSIPEDPQTAEEKTYCRLILLAQAGWPLPGILTRLFPRFWTTAAVNPEAASRLLQGSGVSVLHLAQANVHIRGLSRAKVEAFAREIAPSVALPRSHALRLLMEDMDDYQRKVVIHLHQRMAEILDVRDSSEALRLTIDDLRSADALLDQGLLEVPPEFARTGEAAVSAAPSSFETDAFAGAGGRVSNAGAQSGDPDKTLRSTSAIPSPMESFSAPVGEPTGCAPGQDLRVTGPAADDDFSLQDLAADAGFASEGRYRRKARP